MTTNTITSSEPFSGHVFHTCSIQTLVDVIRTAASDAKRCTNEGNRWAAEVYLDVLEAASTILQWRYAHNITVAL